MSEMNTIPLTKEAITEYLDAAIKVWRGKRDEAEAARDVDVDQSVDAHKRARCYIDAFQSVRSSLFGETLPE